MEGGKKGSKVKRKKGSVLSIFMQSDGVDMLLMGLGFIGAVGEGFSPPLVLFVTGKVMNSFGTAPTHNIESFTHEIKKNSVLMLYIACGRLLAGFLAPAEVITSVSNDSSVIQDVISEKLPNFLVNAATFIGGYVIGFLLLWRLTIVIFPTVLLLVIPGMICGRAVMNLARKMAEEYNKAGTIAGTGNLFYKNCLATGWAVGSNSIVYAIWSFVAYYGTRMVMYHGAQGGTVFVVATTITTGGQSNGNSRAYDGGDEKSTQD
ncbi:hypothetical protein Pint_19364 [Pistacia integerrima]|uniref:Uncharacterized protein n=1 Tax=Pistacia integerrima TaxID=434235 RepID=A0ACC0YWK9_9ROSI|nr:hypothetical protein Pint_19364 [Pistacia integerrima]